MNSERPGPRTMGQPEGSAAAGPQISARQSCAVSERLKLELELRVNSAKRLRDRVGTPQPCLRDCSEETAARKVNAVGAGRAVAASVSSEIRIHPHDYTPPPPRPYQIPLPPPHT